MTLGGYNQMGDDTINLAPQNHRKHRKRIALKPYIFAYDRLKHLTCLEVFEERKRIFFVLCFSLKRFLENLWHHEI